MWQITNAGDQELWRLAHSSQQGTLQLGGEDKVSIGADAGMRVA